MSYTIYPTQVEIVDDTMQNVAVVITAVNDCAAKIEIKSVTNFDCWNALSDAISKALHVMKLYDGATEEVKRHSSTPHGY
jgi:hypothetical protein